ncbi:MAG: hypothetical protein J6X62_06590 [Bacteroidales bacterium]|nr:hypothetical protein [Bacteroidales bacterium]
METATEIARMFRKLIPTRDMLHIAKVVKVDGDGCTVDLDGLQLEGVRLRAVADGSDTGLLLTPKAGSYVLVADLSNGDLRQLAVIAYSEVETIEIHGGDKGGLVNIKQLTNKLNNLVQAFNEHTHNCTAVGSPTGPSLMQTLSFNASDYEDTTIKH